MSRNLVCISAKFLFTVLNSLWRARALFYSRGDSLVGLVCFDFQVPPTLFRKYGQR